MGDQGERGEFAQRVGHVTAPETGQGVPQSVDGLGLQLGQRGDQGPGVADGQDRRDRGDLAERAGCGDGDQDVEQTVLGVRVVGAHGVVQAAGELEGHAAVRACLQDVRQLDLGRPRPLRGGAGAELGPHAGGPREVVQGAPVIRWPGDLHGDGDAEVEHGAPGR